MVNKVILIGNLTRDPELKTLSSGNSVADLGLALNRSYKTGDGEKKEETTFVDITVWGRQAEVLAEHAKKGRQLYIEGRLNLETWDSPEGQKRSKLKVVCENFQFIGGKNDNQAAAPSQGGGAAAAAPATPVVTEVEDSEVPF